MNTFNIFSFLQSLKLIWHDFKTNFLVKYYFNIRFFLISLQISIIFSFYNIFDRVIKNINLKNIIFLTLDAITIILFSLTLIISFIYHHNSPNRKTIQEQNYSILSKQSIQFIKQWKLDFLVSWFVYWQATQQNLRRLTSTLRKISRRIHSSLDNSILNIVQKCLKKLKVSKKLASSLLILIFLSVSFIHFPSALFYLAGVLAFLLITFLPHILNQKLARKCLKLYKTPWFQVIIPLIFLGLLMVGLMTVNFAQQKGFFYFFHFSLSACLPVHYACQQIPNLWRAWRGNKAENLVVAYLVDNNYFYRRNIKVVDEQGNEKGDIDVFLRYRQLYYVLEVQNFVGTIYIGEEEINGMIQPMLRRRYQTVRINRRNRNRNNQPFPGYDRNSCPAKQFLADARWLQQKNFLLQEPICIFVFTHETVVLNIDEQYQVGRFFYFNGVWLIRFDELPSLLPYLNQNRHSIF